MSAWGIHWGTTTSQYMYIFLTGSLIVPWTQGLAQNPSGCLNLFSSVNKIPGKVSTYSLARHEEPRQEYNISLETSNGSWPAGQPSRPATDWFYTSPLLNINFPCDSSLNHVVIWYIRIIPYFNLQFFFVSFTRMTVFWGIIAHLKIQKE